MQEEIDYSNYMFVVTIVILSLLDISAFFWRGCYGILDALMHNRRACGRYKKGNHNGTTVSSKLQGRGR